MMELPQDAFDHAAEEYPRESCGLIVDGQYVRCRNVNDKPGEQFRMSPQDFKRASRRGEVQAVVHSHPDWSAEPSAADRQSCSETGLPWAIIEVRDGKPGAVEWLEPDAFVAPLLGRKFAHGVHDCLTIVLDFYRREMGIDLGDFERRDNWWNEGGDLYRQHLPCAGFQRMPDGGTPMHGDIILMQIRSPVPNHAGVFLADGVLRSEPSPFPQPSCILHHLYGQDSRRDIYGGYWAEKTVGVWRYVGKTEDDSALR